MNATRPLEAAQDGIAELFSVVIPVALVRAQLPHFERLCTTVIDATAGGAPTILRDLLLSCWRERQALGGSAALVLPRTILGLVDAVFGTAGQDARGKQQGWEFSAAIREVIADEMASPELTPALIASRLGISRSSLFALTRELGTTVRRLIIDTRLEAAAVALTEPAWAATTITELALTLGFQDQAHFSRRFTARFGVPPREFRARRLAR
jgi:AraC-like DNA-binding protein